MTIAYIIIYIIIYTGKTYPTQPLGKHTPIKNQVFLNTTPSAPFGANPQVLVLWSSDQVQPQIRLDDRSTWTVAKQMPNIDKGFQYFAGNWTEYPSNCQGTNSLLFWNFKSSRANCFGYWANAFIPGPPCLSHEWRTKSNDGEPRLIIPAVLSNTAQTFLTTFFAQIVECQMPNLDWTSIKIKVYHLWLRKVARSSCLSYWHAWSP